ncbi:MAG: hypothetical protein OXE44_01780 [Nitrospinae bacterium]|nr:hypothetical protein [Nitrospinota bacterium]
MRTLNSTLWTGSLPLLSRRPPSMRMASRSPSLKRPPAVPHLANDPLKSAANRMANRIAEFAG